VGGVATHIKASPSQHRKSIMCIDTTPSLFHAFFQI